MTKKSKEKIAMLILMRLNRRKMTKKKRIRKERKEKKRKEKKRKRMKEKKRTETMMTRKRILKEIQWTCACINLLVKAKRFTWDTIARSF